MKKLYIIYIALLFIFGCKSNDKKYDSIEIMIYNYKWDKLDQSENKDTPYIKSYMYVLIDANSKSKIILQNYSTNDELKYFTFDIDKNNINRLVDSLSNLQLDTAFRVEQICYYEGPSIKIKLNKGAKSKTVSFINDFKDRKNFYINFVQDVYSLQNSNKNRLTLDTLLLLKREMNFINYSFHIDTLIHPLPPLPLNPIKYAPPIIAKDHHKHPKKY